MYLISHFQTITTLKSYNDQKYISYLDMDCIWVLIFILNVNPLVWTSVRTPRGVTDDFSVGMGLHQGFALSPFLFTLAMDELTRGIQDALPWCMLFADVIVLIDEIRQGVNDKLERWRHVLEAKGLEQVDRKQNAFIAVSLEG